MKLFPGIFGAAVLLVLVTLGGRPLCSVRRRRSQRYPTFRECIIRCLHLGGGEEEELQLLQLPGSGRVRHRDPRRRPPLRMARRGERRMLLHLLLNTWPSGK